MVQRITIDPSQLNSSQLATDPAFIALQDDQVHYLRRVLRLKAGDRFIAQDGRGHQWLAEIAEQTNQAQVLETLQDHSQPLATLRLIAALPKGNSFDTVIRQTTELGVTHIHPVISQRTLLKPSASKVARWKRIAQEAAEQSERLTVPEIAEPILFQSCLQSLNQLMAPDQEASGHSKLTDEHSLRFICAARGNYPKTENNNSRNNTEGNGSINNNNHLLSRLLFYRQKALLSGNLPIVTIAIGPEGGWTTDEITVASSYGYEVVSLGSAILRAVTAPITALSLVTAARELLI